MVSAKTIAWIDRLVWTLIYGGLFALVLGLAVLSRNAGTGWSLVAVGAVLAIAGVVRWRSVPAIEHALDRFELVVGHGARDVDLKSCARLTPPLSVREVQRNEIESVLLEGCGRFSSARRACQEGQHAE